MDELISRKAAIDLWDKYHPYIATKAMAYDRELRALPPARSTDTDIQKMQDIEQAMLEKAYECGKQDATQWIPCSERFPEDGERVLATHLGGLNPYKQVIEHIYVNGEFTMGWDMDMNVDSPTFGQRYMGKVIAWMPLPKPYKGEQS